MIAVTLLSAYIYCKRKIFLERVLRLVEIPKEALVKGSIRHQTYDNINKIEQFIVTSIKTKLAYEQIERIYTQKYSGLLRNTIIANKSALRRVKLPLIDAFNKTWPYFIREAKMRAINIHNAILKHDIFGDKLWEVLVPKIKSEVSVQSEELQLRGIIDRLEVFPDKCVPVELKTGKIPKEGVWPSHRIQIGAYVMMLNEKFNLELNKGYVHYLDTDEKREVIINPALKDEIKETTQRVHTLLLSHDLPDFCANENKCNVCGLKEICYDDRLLKEKIDNLSPIKDIK